MFHIELIIEFLENVMNNIVQVAILFFEFVGVIVIILSGLPGGPAGGPLAEAGPDPSGGEGAPGGADRLPHYGYEDHPGAGACCRAGIQVVQ